MRAPQVQVQVRTTQQPHSAHTNSQLQHHQQPLLASLLQQQQQQHSQLLGGSEPAVTVHAALQQRLLHEQQQQLLLAALRQQLEQHNQHQHHQQHHQHVLDLNLKHEDETEEDAHHHPHHMLHHRHHQGEKILHLKQEGPHHPQGQDGEALQAYRRRSDDSDVSASAPLPLAEYVAVESQQAAPRLEALLAVAAAFGHRDFGL